MVRLVEKEEKESRILFSALRLAGCVLPVVLLNLLVLFRIVMMRICPLIFDFSCCFLFINMCACHLRFSILFCFLSHHLQGLEGILLLVI